jgi:integrase
MLSGLTGLKGLSPTTAHHALVTLRVALNRALKWGLVARNVAALADPPKQRSAPIAPLTVEQARALLATAERAQPGGHRLHGLLTVALSAGLRAGELLGLRWDDVDLKRGTVTVRHALEELPMKDRGPGADAAGWRLSEPKSASSRRTLPLLRSARSALTAQRTRVLEARLVAGPRWQEQGGGGFVFPSGVGTPLGYRNMVREYDELLEAAGVPHTRFHNLRHTCASFLLASGADMRTIMAVLGHSQISLTANTYTHVLPAVLDDAAAKLEALLTGAPPAATRR